LLDHLLQGVVEEPQDEARWSVLADWLEEHDDPRRAELLRLHRRLLATCCEPERHPERTAWQEKVVALLAGGVKPCLPQRTILLGERKIPLTFSWIPPGSFLMGSPPQEAERHDEEVLHRVTFGEGFWMGVAPVTQSQWQAVTGENPSRFRHQGGDRPVETVSWEECQAFCEELSWGKGERLRLPSEAEWEYACRAGTTTPFLFGEDLAPEQANFNGEYARGEGAGGVYRKKTTPVDKFPPNAFGLHDCHGNVREWCSDPLGDYPTPSGAGTVDLRPFRGSPPRIARGGAWRNAPHVCRSACRGRSDPANRSPDIGLRLVLEPAGPHERGVRYGLG
jgi:uncharacterized protein (TIGR02996 family)